MMRASFQIGSNLEPTHRVQIDVSTGDGAPLEAVLRNHLHAQGLQATADSLDDGTLVEVEDADREAFARALTATILQL